MQIFDIEVDLGRGTRLMDATDKAEGPDPALVLNSHVMLLSAISDDELGSFCHYADNEILKPPK